MSWWLGVVPPSSAVAVIASDLLILLFTGFHSYRNDCDPSDWPINTKSLKNLAHPDASTALEGRKHKYKSAREVVLQKLYSADNRLKKRRFKVFLADCKSSLVQNVFLECGGVDVDLKSPWIMAWVDGVIPMERCTRMKPYQKINHFPGMSELCKKDSLVVNLKKMQRIFPSEYDFFPRTFRLPDEARSLSEYCQKSKKKFFIIKPDKSCQGSGIEIVKEIHDVKKYKNVVCQKYITRPLLMNNFKFDLRLYVLVTSIDPLRVYVYKEGLVRLATVTYKKPTSSNIKEKRMHLTNYAINRTPNEDSREETIQQGCKKSFAELEAYLDSHEIGRDHLWPTIDKIIVKTILSALPNLKRLFYNSFPMQAALSPCFELLGFDILLSSRVKPFLLEVNRSPSLGGTSVMDCRLKKDLVKNILDMVLPTPKQISILTGEEHVKSARRLLYSHSDTHLTGKERIIAEYQENREKKKMGSFRLLYPVNDGQYDAILQSHSCNPEEIPASTVHQDAIPCPSYDTNSDSSSY